MRLNRVAMCGNLIWKLKISKQLMKQPNIVNWHKTCTRNIRREVTHTCFTISGDETSNKNNVMSPCASPPNSSLDLSSSKHGDDVFLHSVVSDQEALIKVELDVIKSSCPTSDEQSGDLKIANIQFNNLDFVGLFP